MEDNAGEKRPFTNTIRWTGQFLTLNRSTLAGVTGDGWVPHRSSGTLARAATLVNRHSSSWIVGNLSFAKRSIADLRIECAQVGLLSSCVFSKRSKSAR